MSDYLAREDWYNLTSKGITTLREVSAKVKDLKNTMETKADTCYELKLALDCLDNCEYMFYEAIKIQQKK